MKAGYRGTFVIGWAQTEVDGMIRPEVATIGVGSVWRWQGRAMRVDDPRDVLLLEGCAEVARTHAALRARCNAICTSRSRKWPALRTRTSTSRCFGPASM